MSELKLKVHIRIENWTDDMAEGKWIGHDTDGWLQSVAADLIEKAVLAKVGNAGEHHPWGIVTASDLDRLESKVGVSLYDEDGGDVGDETTSGEFICWRDGVPA